MVSEKTPFFIALLISREKTFFFYIFSFWKESFTTIIIYISYKYINCVKIIEI